jgi:hypothetical protein
LLFRRSRLRILALPCLHSEQVAEEHAKVQATHTSRINCSAVIWSWAGALFSTRVLFGLFSRFLGSTSI